MNDSLLALTQRYKQLAPDPDLHGSYYPADIYPGETVTANVRLADHFSASWVSARVWRVSPLGLEVVLPEAVDCVAVGIGFRQRRAVSLDVTVVHRHTSSPVRKPFANGLQEDRQAIARDVRPPERGQQGVELSRDGVEAIRIAGTELDAARGIGLASRDLEYRLAAVHGDDRAHF